MKVKDLIAALGRFDGESDVHIAYNYGDHWRTIVAPGVRRVDEADVVYSDYHSTNRVVDEDDEREHRDARSVVVIR